MKQPIILMFQTMAQLVDLAFTARSVEWETVLYERGNQGRIEDVSFNMECWILVVTR